MSSDHRIFTLKNKRNMPAWLAWLLAMVMRLYAWTLRRRIVDPNGLLRRGCTERPNVYVLWHNRILLAAAIIPREVAENLAMMVSSSRDGGYIATVIRRFGIHSIRGSSSRGAASVLRASVEALQEGHSPTITVDGPRGPRYTVHSGALLLGRQGYDIVPISFNYSHYWHFRSWDRMQLPWPFAKVEFRVGAPVELPSGDTSSEEGCEAIRKALLAITED